MRDRGHVCHPVEVARPYAARMAESQIMGPLKDRVCGQCGGEMYVDVRTEDYGRRDAYFFCNRNRCEFHGHDPIALGVE